MAFDDNLKFIISIIVISENYTLFKQDIKWYANLKIPTFYISLHSDTLRNYSYSFCYNDNVHITLCFYLMQYK